jgi:hypothetical protein
MPLFMPGNTRWNSTRTRISLKAGAWRRFLEGTRARSRNKDSKNVPDATTSFKTVACLNVTLADAKIAQF